MPKTLFDDFIENDLTNRFYGKLEISYGVSFLYFYKTGITQKLLHQFKYNNYPEIGEMIGSPVFEKAGCKTGRGDNSCTAPPKKRRKKRIYSKSILCSRHFRSYTYPNRFYFIS